MRDISELIRNIEIENVRVVEATLRTSVKPQDEAGPIEAKISRNAHVTQAPDDGLFVVRTDFTFSGHPGGDKKSRANAVVSIGVSFELTYRIPTNMSTAESDLDEFAKANAIFNAWPYFREFVHAALVRMGLPPFVLPVLRLAQPKKVETKEKTEAKALAGTH